jgi:hypothetical protein
MMPSMQAFTEELVLIKTAKIFKDSPRAKDVVKHLALGGAGLGIGAGGAYLIGEKVLPNFLPSLTSKQRMIASMVTGGLAGLIAARTLAQGGSKK